MRGSWAVPILLALAFIWLFAEGKSCTTDVAPQLVRVLEVVPSEVEIGDRVAILGEGFPPGKPAHVVFQGALHRPGERPQRNARITVEATVVAPNRLEFAFDDPIQALFCGAGDRANHTTFEGNVEVAFAAAAPGAAPIAGVLEHSTIDVRPSASASLRAREREGERVLAWLGITATAGPSGLAVSDLKQGSPAASAGIGAGDLLTSFDGVRVASAADVVPWPGEEAATLLCRTLDRRERGERTFVIPMRGFRRAPPVELVPAALLVLAGLAMVWFLAAPDSPLLAALSQRIVSRMCERIRRGGSAGGWMRAARGVARATLPASGSAAMLDVVVYLVLAVMPLGPLVFATGPDVGLLFIAGVAFLATAAWIARRSAWQGLRAALEIAWQHTPAAVAVASIVVTTGSLRIQEIEQAQGGWPWEWLAFRSPASLMALGLLLGCSLIDPDADGGDAHARGGLAVLLEDAPQEVPTRRRPWLEGACRAHRIVVAGLAAILFLGGWLLPGWSAAEQNASPALQMAGAACLLGKTWTLALVMAGIRWALPGRRLAHGTRATALWLAPVALASLGVTAAWTWWGPPPAGQLLVSASLVAAVGIGAVALGRRLRHGLLTSGADGHLSPFL
jgi:NADH-quinone oxidoreductase subunit H